MNICINKVLDDLQLDDETAPKLLLADARASEDPTKLPGPLHKALVAEYRRRFGSDAAAAEQLCQLAEQILRECVGVETNKAQCLLLSTTLILQMSYIEMYYFDYQGMFATGDGSWYFIKNWISGTYRGWFSLAGWDSFSDHAAPEYYKLCRTMMIDN